MTNYSESTLVRTLTYLSDSQAAISNNIANATTGGYKRKTPVATGIEGAFLSTLDRTLPAVQYSEFTDFTKGSERSTSDDMTASLGEGQFFRVTDGRNNYYTRRGEFVLDAQGMLVTPSGERFLGFDGQPISIGSVTEMRIATDGTINAITEDGNDAELGRLGVYRVDNDKSLVSAGRSLFLDRSGQEPTPHLSPSVRQGYAEESNVEVLRELIQMIHVQRSFDATSRALSSVSQILGSYAQAMNR